MLAHTHACTHTQAHIYNQHISLLKWNFVYKPVLVSPVQALGTQPRAPSVDSTPHSLGDWRACLGSCCLSQLCSCSDSSALPCGMHRHRGGLPRAWGFIGGGWSTEVLSDQRPKDSVTSWRWWQRRVSWSADMGLREEQDPDKRPQTSPRWGSARVGARRVGENLTPTELRLRESPRGRNKQKGATMWRWQPTSIWSIHLGIHNVPKVGPHSKCHQSRVKRRPSGVFPPQSATISTWCSLQGTVNLSSWRTPTAFQLCDVWQCTRFSLSYTGEQHVAPSWGGCENPVRWCSPALGRVSWSTAMLTTIPAKVTVSPTCHNHHRLERDSEVEVTPGHGMFW